MVDNKQPLCFVNAETAVGDVEDKAVQLRTYSSEKSDVPLC